MCKYHGWRYGLDGALNFVLREEEYFDFEKNDFGLIPVHCDIWEGFIFVNLDDDTGDSRYTSFSGRWSRSRRLSVRPMVERYGTGVGDPANWKIFLDAFQEYYHAPILHSQQQVSQLRNFEYGFNVPYFQLDGPHRLISTGGLEGHAAPSHVDRT